MSNPNTYQTLVFCLQVPCTALTLVSGETSTRTSQWESASLPTHCQKDRKALLIIIHSSEGLHLTDAVINHLRKQHPEVTKTCNWCHCSGWSSSCWKNHSGARKMVWELKWGIQVAYVVYLAGKPLHVRKRENNLLSALQRAKVSPCSLPCSLGGSMDPLTPSTFGIWEVEDRGGL